MPAASAACLLLLVAAPTSAGGAATADLVPVVTPFTGTAAAYGTRITATIPGGPIADTPVDAGGPTAQATLDSLGTSQGYAAFPDPGPVVISLPGLVGGLVGSGVAGLPPIPLPSLPSYPLYISSDPVTRPRASAGAGPYELTAQSGDRAAAATASAGVKSGAIGNVARLESQASVHVEADGSVVAEAHTEIQGLTIGPLSIGDVRSSATLTRSADGVVTPDSSLSIDVLRLGGVGVAITPKSLDVAGIVVDLPLQDVLAGLLKAFGVTLEVMPVEKHADGIVGATLRITAPLDLSGLGSGPGQFSLSLGSVSAHLEGSAMDTAPDEPEVIPDGGLFTGDGGGSSISFDGPLPVVAPAEQPVLPPAAVTQPVEAPTLVGLESRLAFDVSSLYLMVMLLGCGVLITSVLVRLLGVRAPWASSGG